jgi:hypothetical protein
VSERVFEKAGMGYRLVLPRLGTELIIERLKHEGGHLNGDLIVKTTLPGARTHDGVLHTARFNLTATATRGTIGRYLAARVEGRKEDALDWVGFVEELCNRVMAAERDAEPIQRTNGISHPDSSELLLRPFLPVGMPTSLYADGMAGKSLLALAMGLTVASGHAVIPGLTARRTGPVLYLDWETDFPVIDVRQKRLSAGAGLPPQTILYRRCRRTLAEIAEEVSRVVADEGVILVVVDSVTMAMGAGKENSDAADSTLRFYGALAAIGGTSLTIDHVAKGSDGTKPYGSIYRSNLARATWFMKKVAEDDEVAHVVLTHEKHNTTRKLGPVGLSIDWGADDDDPLSPVTIRQEPVGQYQAPRAVPMADRVEVYLRGAGHPLRVGEIAKGLGLDDHSAVSQALRRNPHRFREVSGAGWFPAGS